MKKVTFCILGSLICLSVVGCNKDNPVVPPKYEKTNKFTIKDGESFKVANFADLHIGYFSDLDEKGGVYKTIKHVVEEFKPDIITFSGDNAENVTVGSNYKLLCDIMDSFKTPYFFVFGNHDRSRFPATKFKKIFDESEYGYIDLGPNDLDSDGNYTIDIYKDNNIIHSIVMMDSRGKANNNPDDFTYIDNPIPGVIYNEYDGRPYAGNSGYEGIKGKQLEWYKEQIERVKCETSLITHIPLMEYLFAFERYKDALNKEDQETIDRMAPIGPCLMGENCASSTINYGFFDLIKELESTKNIICGHDHDNNYSLLYDGVRLTYAVKTGNAGYYPSDDLIGFTSLTISDNGSACIEQNFYNPFK